MIFTVNSQEIKIKLANVSRYYCEQHWNRKMSRSQVKCKHMQRKYKNIGTVWIDTIFEYKVCIHPVEPQAMIKLQDH